MQALGTDVRTLTANRDLPDCVFIEDTAIILDELAVLASMGTDSRRGEPAGIEAALSPHREIRRIERPAAIEGGDVLRVGRTLLVGISSRTNRAGVAALAAIAAPLGYRVVPVPVRGLANFKRLAKIILPLAGYLPVGMLTPPGAKDEAPHPKFERYWAAADLIAGDMHYIRKYACEDLSGKFVITNTTTEENLDLLRQRGVRRVLTMTPRYEGRSFGTNLMEAVLTAYAGLDRPLSIAELDALVDEIDLRPELHNL